MARKYTLLGSDALDPMAEAPVQFLSGGLSIAAKLSLSLDADGEWLELAWTCWTWPTP